MFLFLLLFYSCTVDQQKLVGSWQAVAYFEMSQTVNTPLHDVRLTFSATGDYSFNSIGLYEELGQYRVAGKYLFLLDTTVVLPKERAVKIHYLSNDSLKIGMEADGKRSAVFFGRIQ